MIKDFEIFVVHLLHNSSSKYRQHQKHGTGSKKEVIIEIRNCGTKEGGRRLCTETEGRDTHK